MDLSALPPLADKKARIAYEQLRSELNDLPQIDYERVQEAKTGYLRLLFAQDGERVMATKAYRQFFQENERWLVPYAQYCSLRDRYGSADFSTLPAPITNGTSTTASRSPRPARKPMARWRSTTSSTSSSPRCRRPTPMRARRT